MCGVCMFHDWCKTKSHACGKPRLLQATCKNPNRTICATCPGTDPSPMISSWASRLEAIESPRAGQGLGVLFATLRFLFNAGDSFLWERLEATGTSWLLTASFFLSAQGSKPRFLGFVLFWPP